MCEIIVKAVDHRMPTVEEWRKWITDEGVPRAEKYLLDNPYTKAQFDKASTDLNRMQDYNYSKTMLQRSVEGKANLTATQIMNCTNTVLDYGAHPVSKAEKDLADHLLRDQDSKTPSIQTQWTYHKNIIEVESKREDKEKEIELQKKDRTGCYKAGYPHSIFPDGTTWGNEERLPKFVIIKIPGVSVDHPLLQKFTQRQLEDTPNTEGRVETYRRRLWQIRLSDLPLAARNKLGTEGELTIKSADYDGVYDLTWTQFKGYIRNLKTGLDETEEL